MVTRAEFIQAVRDFKKVHGGKLKDLLNRKTNPEATDAFLNNPVIHAYLARPSVTFVDQHPLLQDSKTKEEHDASDHYELMVYKYLPGAIAYRDSDITSSKFYVSGTEAYRHEFFDNILQSFNRGLPDIAVNYPSDIYAIAFAVHRHVFASDEEASPRFLISPNWKDTHASACITILDPSTRHALITLFINSSQNFGYYSYIKERFLKRSFNTSSEISEHIVKRLKNYLTKTFSIDPDEASLPTQPTSLLVNKEERAALAINYHSYSKEYEETEHSPEIETIYDFSMSRYYEPPAPILTMAHTPKTPFIDVSHHLQQRDDDRNCVLYSTNFIQAMVEMLKQPAVADRVFELARNVKTNPAAIETLVHIFREDLKAYLPCYYDRATGTPKSDSELEAFHLNQRWELGGKSLSILHPVKQTDVETVAVASSPVNTASRSGFFAGRGVVSTGVSMDATIKKHEDDKDSTLSS